VARGRLNGIGPPSAVDTYVGRAGGGNQYSGSSGGTGGRVRPAPDVKIASAVFGRSRFVGSRNPGRDASRYCPVAAVLGDSYHWSIAQAEYATDIVFARQQQLAHIYDHLVRTAVHSAKPDAVATFLGRKLTATYNDEAGNRFDTRIVGTRIRHSMGPASIKMYDKAGIALRIETTTNDVSFFKHFRPVVQKDGSVVQKLAQMRRSIVSLPALRTCMAAANRRYLAFLSELDHNANAEQNLSRLTKTVTDNDRPYKGLNFFDMADLALLYALARGEFHISGFRNKNLRNQLQQTSPAAISRALKRLRLHGLIKRIGRTYKYYLTALGRRAITLGLRIRQLIVVPQLAAD
jgi:DNA-binding MarR family transcriptional regulator